MAKTGGEGSGLTDLPPSAVESLNKPRGSSSTGGWSSVCSTSPPQGFDGHRYIKMVEEDLTFGQMGTRGPRETSDRVQARVGASDKPGLWGWPYG